MPITTFPCPVLEEGALCEGDCFPPVKLWEISVHQRWWRWMDHVVDKFCKSFLEEALARHESHLICPRASPPLNKECEYRHVD